MDTEVAGTKYGHIGVKVEVWAHKWHGTKYGHTDGTNNVWTHRTGGKNMGAEKNMDTTIWREEMGDRCRDPRLRFQPVGPATVEEEGGFRGCGGVR